MREVNGGALAEIIKGGGGSGGGNGGGGGSFGTVGGGGGQWSIRRRRRRAAKGKSKRRSMGPRKRKANWRRSIKRLKHRKVGKRVSNFGGVGKRINKKRRKAKKRFAAF